MLRWFVVLAVLASSGACAPHELAFGAPCTSAACAEGYACVDGVCLPDAAEGEGEGEGELVNRPPLMFGASVVMRLPGGTARTASGQLDATDPDGDALSFSVVAAPADVELSVDANTGAFTVTSSTSTAADHLTATVEVSDGAATDRADIAIFIVDFVPESNVQAVWTGAVSESVDDDGNWLPATPQTIMTVFIPADAPRMPALSADIVWRGLYVESGAFIEAGTRSVTITGGNELPCIVGGEIRSTALSGGLTVNGVRLAGALPTVATDGTVEVIAPTRAASLDVSSEAGGFSVAASSLHVTGDAVLHGSIPIFVTDTRVVIDGDADMVVFSNGVTISGGELRCRRDLFIRCNASFLDGARVVLDGPGPQRVASFATLVDVEVAADVTLVEAPNIDSRLSIFNSLRVAPNGSIAADVVTLTLLTDATLELAPGAEVSGALVELGGPVSAQGAVWDVERTRLKSLSLLPWPTDLVPRDVEVALGTTVQLGDAAALDGALEIAGALEVGEHQLDVGGALDVSVDGRLFLVEPLAVVTVGGGASLAGLAPDAAMTAGLLRVAGDLLLSSPSDVVSFSGPDLTIELTGASTVFLDPVHPCQSDTGNDCRITNLTIANGAQVSFPTLLFVDETLRVEGSLLVDGSALVVGDLLLAQSAQIVSGGCGSTGVETDPAIPSDRQVCIVYVEEGGTCTDDTGTIGCP